MEISISNRKKIFITLLLSSIIGSLIQTALNTALVPIMRDLNIGPETSQWLVSSYTLVTGIMVLSTAFLIRRFNARFLYIIAMSIFCIGLLLSATATIFSTLLVGRIFQAVATGVLLSLTQVVILTTFPPEERGTKMGVFGLAASAAPILSPTLSGIIIDISNWRMIFWLTLMITIISFIFGLFNMKNIVRVEKSKFDIFSFILCSSAFMGIVIGLGNLGRIREQPLQLVIPILIGILSMIIFVKRQLSLNHPFLNLNVFANYEFRTAILSSMLLYSGMIAASTILPLYMQTMRGFSATVSGLVTMPGSLLTALFSPISGKIYDKWGIRKLYISGSILLFIGYTGLIFLNSNTPLFYIVTVFSLRQIGIGLLLMPTVTWGMSTLSTLYTADGTALINSLRTISGSIGSAVFISLITLFSSSKDSTSMIKGTQYAFLGITLLSITLLIIAILFIGKTTGITSSKAETNSTDLRKAQND